MFKNVEAHAGVRGKLGQFRTLLIQRVGVQRVDVAYQGAQVRMAGVASLEFFDAAGFFIQREDGIPIQQTSGEISHPTAHFYDAPADFARYETRLPREIVFRLAHPLLIARACKRLLQAR